MMAPERFSLQCWLHHSLFVSGRRPETMVTTTRLTIGRLSNRFMGLDSCSTARILNFVPLRRHKVKWILITFR